MTRRETLVPAVDLDDVGVNDSTEPALATIVDAALTRRHLLLGAMATSALVGVERVVGSARAEGTSSLTFAELPHGRSPDDMVAPGYSRQILMRWGDPMFPDSPAWSPTAQSAAAQERQFGYNNDFVAYLPLPRGSDSSDHGLLAINHEYTQLNIMFPGLDPKAAENDATRALVDVELAAHGMSVLEVRKQANRWIVVPDSRYTRRITAMTPMTFSGPAAGHDRLKTLTDPTGRTCLGTINNCGGGKTPWGTVLTAEENFHGYFAGETDGPEARNHKRYGITARSRYAWSRFHDRFDLTKDPNEPNKFGWVVEVDAHDPASVPVKRTALGRLKHEAATCVVNLDGRVVVYMGDDERKEYVYKFISRDRYDPAAGSANARLLDDGTLYVARFDADMTMTWMPLEFGQGPLTPQNGFASQADVVIELRRAADLLKATPMDRPEDIETNPVNGRVYALMTADNRRQAGEQDAANPRPRNFFGHVLELIPPGTAPKLDHAALKHGWDIFLLAGDPAKPELGARYGQPMSRSGWLANPDNVAFDPRGRMWLASDQGTAQADFGIGDGIWACDVEGPGRAVTRFFYRCPTGAEMCGPEFTPDGRSLFLAVQHPAGDDKGSHYEKPTTRWPDFMADVPPRPALIVIVKDDGGEIGA
jgi:secreted PhoX family phosphatase